MVTNEIMTTAIYIRVSTEDQATEGFSINAQKEKLTKYLEANGWELYNIYIDDGISGKNLKDRPQIKSMLEEIKKKNINNVLVYKLDRLTRSLSDLMDLMKLFDLYDCSLNSQTEKLDTSNAVGRMFLKIIGTFAEFERENLSERVSFGYEQKTREGGYTNVNGVYGYDYIVGEGKLAVRPLEAQIVRDVYDKFLNGKAMITIAKEFNESNVPTKRGGSWSQSTIKSILTNPLYIGKIRYGVGKKLKNRAFEVDGSHKAIIDEDTFNKVQEQISKRKKFNIKKLPSVNAYFSSVLICGNCGSRFHAKQQVQKGKTYISYYCNNRQLGKCNCPGISHNKILNAFESYIETITLDEDIELPKDSNNQEEVDLLQKELDNLDKKRKRVQTLFIDEAITSEDYKEFISDIVEQKELIEEQLRSFTKEKEEQIDSSLIKKFITNLKLNWDYLDEEERYSFLLQFVGKIVVKVEDGGVTIKELKFN